MDTNDATLVATFDTATGFVKRALTKKEGADGKESAYGIAYQALVRAGLAPQIRAKYRTGSRAKNVRRG